MQYTYEVGFHVTHYVYTRLVIMYVYTYVGMYKICFLSFYYLVVHTVHLQILI